MEGGSGLQHATVEVPCLEVAVAVGSGDCICHPETRILIA